MEENNINVNEEVVEQTTSTEVEEKMLPQSKVNEIVEKRLAKERNKLDKQWQDKFNALEEKIKLQSMTEEQIAQHEYEKRVHDLEEREKALQERENAYNKQQYQNEIINQLQAKGLPSDLSDLLVGFDAETVAQKIDSLAQSMGVSVNTQIQEKLKQTTTPQEPTQRKQLFTLQEIQAMNLEEYQANKELINESLKEIYKK